jgi:hypothetical protein
LALALSLAALALRFGVLGFDLFILASLGLTFGRLPAPDLT